MPNELREMLATLRPDHVREEAQKLDAEADDLRRQSRALFAMADALAGELGDPVNGGSNRSGHTANGNGNRRILKPTNKRPLIAKLIAERPTPAWTVKEVHSTLIARDMVDAATTLESIRVTLKRMADKPRSEKERLARTPDARYTLPGRDHEGTLR